MIARHTETLTVDIDLKRMSDIELSQREHYGLNGGGGFLPFAHPSLTHVTCLIPKHVPKEIIQIHFKRESALWHTRKSMESRESVTRRGSIHAPRFIIDTPLCLIRQDLARLRDLFEAFGISTFIRRIGARQFKICLFDFGTGLILVHP
jgi:hypothetical protein